MPNFPHPYRNLRQFYRDTKSNILNITGVEQGATAYATDTNEVGSYNGTSWVWIKYDALNANNITTGTLGLDRIPNTLTGKDADTLDGQHGSYYLNASNINAGELNKERYFAYDNLVKFGFLSDQYLYDYIRDHFTTSTMSGYWNGWTTTPASVLYNAYSHVLRARPSAAQINVTCFLYKNLTINNGNSIGAWVGADSNYCEVGIRLDNGYVDNLNNEACVEFFIKAGVGTYLSYDAALFKRWKSPGNPANSTQVSSPFPGGKALVLSMIKETNVIYLYASDNVVSDYTSDVWLSFSQLRVGLFVRTLTNASRSGFFHWFGCDQNS